MKKTIRSIICIAALLMTVTGCSAKNVSSTISDTGADNSQNEISSSIDVLETVSDSSTTESTVGDPEKVEEVQDVESETVSEIGVGTIELLSADSSNDELSEKKDLLDNIAIIRKTLCSTKNLEHKQSALYDEMSMLAELTEKCVVENSRQPLNQQEYQRKYNSLVERYEAAKARYEEVNEQIGLRKAREKVLSAFAAAVKNNTGVITEFDESLWGTLVDYIVVHGRGDVRVVFRDGSEVKI